MSLTPTPFGAETPGRARFGDGAEQLASISAKGLLATYTLAPPGTKALLATYTIQQWGTASMGVYYALTPAVQAFSINGTVVPAPEDMQYGLLAAIGADLSALPVLQGWSSMTWAWSQMVDSEIARLMPFYTTNAQTVTIVYPNELGFWVQKSCYLQPITLGERRGVFHSGVSLTFTHISSD